MKQLLLFLVLQGLLSTTFAQSTVSNSTLTSSSVDKAIVSESQLFLQELIEGTSPILLNKLGINPNYLLHKSPSKVAEITIDSAENKKKVVLVEYEVSSTNSTILVKVSPDSTNKNDFYSCWRIAYAGPKSGSFVNKCPINVLNVELPEGLLPYFRRIPAAKGMITLTRIEVKDNLWINNGTPNQLARVRDLENINSQQFKSGKLALQTKVKTEVEVTNLQKLLSE